MPTIRSQTLAAGVLAIAVSACTEPAAVAGNSSTSSSSSSSTTSGADSTSGGAAQCPVVPHVDPTLAQALSPNFMAVTPADVRSGTLCPSTSHYYTLDNPCPVYLALDLRGNPTAIDNITEDFDLYLTEHYDPSQPGASYTVHRSNGSASASIGPPLPFEALHKRLDAAGGNPHLIEVRHIAGAELDYQLQVVPLVNGSCFSASWVCATTVELEAQETACVDEPNPACTTTTTSVALPTVDDNGMAVDGWRVHTGPAEVAQIHNPTSAELALIESRCIQACRDQWSYDDAVSANCSVLDGFRTPHTPEISAPAIDAIAAADQDGSGIFTGQQLTCNLTGSCCDEFDEDVCVAIPRRVTPGPDVLTVGQEYRLAIGGTSELTIATSAGSWTSDLSGTVGHSLCPGGSSSGPCPFYLGSASVTATQQPSITLGCSDGSQEILALNAATFELGQPALGIDPQGTSSKGFPPGALVLDASLTLGTDVLERRAPNTEPVVLLADATSFQLTGAQLQFVVPCGRGVEVVTATFDLTTSSTNQVLDGPPTVAITTPSSVTCGASVSLTASTGDPDGDFDSVRWYVDDELVAAATTSIQVTVPHTLRAVARDARGAATTATQSITCTP